MLTREQLHAMVWSEPMATLAIKFGMSGVALRKKCIRHAVPVPGRGFWQRVGAGSAPPPSQLPDTGDARLIEFWCQGGADSHSSASANPTFADRSVPSVVVRTRADHIAEARQMAVMRRRRLDIVAEHEREARAKAIANRAAIEKLEAEAMVWDRAQKLRSYIAAVATAPATDPAGRANWVAWATRYADAIDPLHNDSACGQPPMNMASPHFRSSG